MSKSMTATGSLALASVLLIGSSAAADTQRTRTSPPIVIAEESSAGGGVLAVDTDMLDYGRLLANGLLEYGFVPPALWSPPPSTPSLKPELVATLFLHDHAGDLGIAQPVADFKLESSEYQCDGSTLVTFQQTHAFLAVESSYLRFTVQDQRVTYTAARFVLDVSRLPVCQPRLNGTEILVSLSYLPETGASIVVAGTIDQFQGPQMKNLRDACTGELLGRTTIYK